MADAPAKKKSILFVDDDELQHAIIDNMLKDYYEVYKAKSGQEAIRILCQEHFVPDLIILDILMPQMNGWDVYSNIKGIGLLKDVPVAFLTAVNDKAEEERAYEMGADDFITKPYEKEILLDRIQKVLAKQKT